MQSKTIFLGPIFPETTRLRILIRGGVQGTDFSSFVSQLAEELDFKGWIRHVPQGVTIEAEGQPPRLDELLVRLHRDKPIDSFIQNFQYSTLDPLGATDFLTLNAAEDANPKDIVLADIATCPECLKEIFDSRNRRYFYPFTNCAHCGPRYSIAHTLPFQRQNTALRSFAMCPQCRLEQEDPQNRRFQAQLNACQHCGPVLELWDRHGKILANHQQAIAQAVQAVREGKIVALKGLGGFKLIADAHNEAAIQRLRMRKNREEKPFTVMFPRLEDIADYCRVSFLENYLLISRESPVVILEKQRSPDVKKQVAYSVSMNNPYLGAMLPYSSLYHIFMHELESPIVVISGNVSNEPICIDEKDALKRLREIADVFLVHNRPVLHPVDDSVVRVMVGRPLVLRRGRGYAPLPIEIKETGESVLAVGGHLNNSMAVVRDNNVFLSQQIGDLESSTSYDTFKKMITNFKEMYTPQLKRIACDLHPQYLSTQYAEYDKYPVVRVQHHHAHIVSCMAENDLNEEVLGIAWDDTGYGTDKTIWGGEFLLSTLSDFKRVAHFRSFLLPGGENTVKDPAQIALGMLAEISPENLEEFRFLLPFKTLTSAQFDVMKKMLERRRSLHTQRTSSVGKLFDAVASILGLQQRNGFDGQAAMSLEYAIQDVRTEKSYDFEIINPATPDQCWVIDWALMIRQIIEDIRKNLYQSEIAAKFHNTLVEMAIGVVKLAEQKKVVLSGGCFQNKYLSERLIIRLKEEGFQPYWHQWVPPDDGGIALGQAVVALSRSSNREI